MSKSGPPSIAIGTAFVFALVTATVGWSQEKPGLEQRWGNKVFRQTIEPHWLAGNERFWYRVETGPKTHEFVFVNAREGRRAPAFDHAKLAVALEKATGQKQAAEALPLKNLQMPTAEALYFQVNQQWWQWQFPQETLQKVDSPPGRISSLQKFSGQFSQASSEPTKLSFHNRSDRELALLWIAPDGQRLPYGKIAPGASTVQSTYIGHVFLIEDEKGKPVGICRAGADHEEVTLTNDLFEAESNSNPAAPIRDPEKPSAQSPDGQWTVRVKDHDVELLARDGTIFPLSKDGTGHDRYEDEFYWSPDSRFVAGYRLRLGERHRIPLIESSPGNQIQPRLQWRDYLKPGDRIDQRRPFLFHIPEKRAVPLPHEELWENPWSMGPIRWSADAQRFSFLYNQRGHQIMRMVEVNALNGQAQALIEEKSATFIDYSQKTFLHRMEQSEEILWMSERDGWNHLWRFDAKTGLAGRQITRGEWVVRRMEHVDETGRRLWFWAGGVIAGQDPYYEHLCRVNLDGSDFRVLTEGDGTHRAEFSPDRKWFIDQWSRIDQPPRHELRRAEDGTLVCTLEQADDALLRQSGWNPPERFHAPGRDGKTEIYGIIIKPGNLAPKQRYPVVEEIYAGPHGAFVPKAWGLQIKQRELVERGFILVQIDGMGTNWRSRAFHDVAWKNLKDGGLPDRMAWLKAAAETRPWMDLNRVGIYGGSAGGQSALGALLFHGDFYKVGVADCGCHDNRMDKIWWNEAWMGWPVGPEYADSSNVTHAHRLTGKLLLIAGELDDNVDPASTMQVVNALVKADKDFDLLVIPGARHGAAETPYGQRRRTDFLVRHLMPGN